MKPKLFAGFVSKLWLVSPLSPGRPTVGFSLQRPGAAFLWEDVWTGSGTGLDPSRGFFGAAISCASPDASALPAYGPGPDHREKIRSWGVLWEIRAGFPSSVVAQKEKKNYLRKVRSNAAGVLIWMHPGQKVAAR